MGDEQTIEVLRYARDVILTDPSKWCKRTHSRNQFGSAVAPDHLSATSFCVDGALIRSLVDLSLPGDLLSDVEKPLRAAAGGCFVSLNDDPVTTYEEIVSLFDRAIKTLEDPA